MKVTEEVKREVVEMDTVNKIVKFYYGITEEQYKSLKEVIAENEKRKKTTMTVLLITNIVMVIGILCLVYFLK